MRNEENPQEGLRWDAPGFDPPGKITRTTEMTLPNGNTVDPWADSREEVEDALAFCEGERDEWDSFAIEIQEAIDTREWGQSDER